MIVFDVETTGLPQTGAVPLEQQPQIIEFGGIRLNNETLEEESRLEFLANPGKPLDDKIVEITGITDEMLKDAPPFSAAFEKLVDFFLGETILVAHNLAFDGKLLWFELRRLDALNKFPWPWQHKCTMELSKEIFGKWTKLNILHKELTGETFEGAHRAIVDAEATVRVIKKYRERGMI